PLLQGAGIMRLSVWLLLLSAGSKAWLNWLLVPQRGIQGAAISANVSLALSASVGMLTLLVVASGIGGISKLTIIMREIIKPSLAVIGGIIAMLAVTRWMNQLWWSESITRLQVTAYVLVAVGIGAVVYGVVIWLLRAVKQHELKQL